MKSNKIKAYLPNDEHVMPNPLADPSRSGVTELLINILIARNAPTDPNRITTYTIHNIIDNNVLKQYKHKAYY